MCSETTKVMIMGRMKANGSVSSNPRNVQDIAEMLADGVPGWEIEAEGYGPWVETPEGTTHIDESIIDPDQKRHRDEKPEGTSGFSPEKYGHIGTLVIPETVVIGNYDRFSFFAGEGMKPGVTSVCPYAFCGQQAPEKVTLPDGR